MLRIIQANKAISSYVNFCKVSKSSMYSSILQLRHRILHNLRENAYPHNITTIKTFEGKKKYNTYSSQFGQFTILSRSLMWVGRHFPHTQNHVHHLQRCFKLPNQILGHLSWNEMFYKLLWTQTVSPFYKILTIIFYSPNSYAIQYRNREEYW